MQEKDQYELIIKTNDELDNKSYLIKQLEEMEGILRTYDNRVSEVKLRKVKLKENQSNRHSE